MLLTKQLQQPIAGGIELLVALPTAEDTTQKMGLNFTLDFMLKHTKGKYALTLSEMRSAEAYTQGESVCCP